MQALEFVSKFVVVNAEAMKNGRIKVPHVHWILYNVVAIVVGLAKRNPGADASAGHPRRETAGMMVATIILLAQTALAVHGPPEFTCPNDQRVVE